MDNPGGIREIVERMRHRFAWLDGLIVQGSGRPAGETGDMELPLLTSSVLERFYYTDSNPLAMQPGIRSYRTSGTSSGRRKTIYYSEQDEADYLRVKLDVFRDILEPYGYKTAVSDMGTGHAEATAAEVFRQLGMTVESLSFRLPIRQHIESLERLRPEVLYTMPSILDRLLAAAGEPAALGIRHVILVGETASPGWRSQAAQRLGIGEDRITDTYGSIEIGTIASYSPRCGRYLLADGIIAEGVSAEELGEGLRPLSEGEQVLVLTSSIREAFPALRYVTYDVVRDLRTIEVEGVPRQSFHSLVKRIGPDLKHGEKISIYDIEDTVCRHLGSASVRVVVEGNSLRIAVDSGQGSDAALELIRQELENRNPDIGTMIRSGILGGIQVVRKSLDDTGEQGSVKNKKIHYRQGEFG
ncbi:coenzyme F390 synthetase [Paenibacillus sp. D9]|uniref:AMP-binding protein n=1 Tax=Paenibacillus sp. D9 TaxID=665792 RepID=UPI00061F35F9|nr:AMP-binding protein [Paenibacillus sp. D9]KKC48583.1 coenzyme F390 synthetase [Paenibacillus sp. D9]